MPKSKHRDRGGAGRRITNRYGSYAGDTSPDIQRDQFKQSRFSYITLYSAICASGCASYLWTALILQLVQQLGRRLLAISLRVVPRPAPEILASLLEGALGLPPELGVRARRVGREVEDVAVAAGRHLVGEIAANGSREGANHVVDSAALTGAKVPGTDAGVICAQVVEGLQVAVGKVEDVDVVANRGSVVRVII